MVASVEASWNGYGASVSGSASFGTALSESKGLEKTTGKIFYSGDMLFDDGQGGLVGMDIDDLEEQLLRFDRISSSGTGIAHTLVRFDRHPDYLKIATDPSCGLVQRLAYLDQKATDGLFE